MDNYIADLRAKTQVEQDLKNFNMRRFGIPQERIARCLGIVQATIHNHLSKMPELAILINTDLKRGVTVAQVTEKHAKGENKTIRFGLTIFRN